MKTVRANSSYWILGTLVAFAGVVSTRMLAPSFHGSARIGVTIGSEFLALGGLFIICLGVRRRIKQAAIRNAQPAA
jgi:hypothetical protein